MWTMEELVERVHSALAAEYPGAPNGRVRDLPDRRSIRWYTTIGLVDRPLGMRGRSALYGPRHLWQLVAIKRRQAAGRTLAEIQAELAGASDEILAAVALVSPELLEAGPPQEQPPPRTAGRARFWAEPPTRSADHPAAHPVAPAVPAAPTADLTGFALGAGVFLLVPHAVSVSDLDRADLAAAAAPLMALLASAGLTDGSYS